MIRAIEQWLANQRYRQALRDLEAHRDANAKSVEIRNFTANRAAGKLGHHRRIGRAAA